MTAYPLREALDQCKRHMLALLLAFATSLGSHAVLVAWDANPASEGVEGYKVYLASDGATNAPMDVGSVLIAPLPNLHPGVQYQIYITAYNAAGESDPSESLFYTPPAGSVLPAIVRQPSNGAVPQGTPIVLEVGASGTGPLRYDWMHNGIPLPNSNTSLLVLENAEISKAGAYTVRVSNPLGTITSQAASVSIVTRPVITAQPESKSVLQGSRFSLFVPASGTPPLTYQWQKGTANIPGATSSSLAFSNVQSTNSGNYRVLVSNAAGTVTSSNLTLEVLSPAHARAPSFGRVLADTNVFVGDTVTLDPLLAGTEPLSVQWYRYSTPLPGQNSRTLTLGPLALEDAGRYYAVAFNGVGSATSSMSFVAVSEILDLFPPEIVTQPGSLLANHGTHLILEVEALSDGPISYQWMKNGADLKNETNAVLRLKNISVDHDGDYSVLVSNSAGSELSDIVPLRIHALPFLSTNPVDFEVAEGGSITLVGDAETSEAAQFQWHKNGAPIAGAIHSSFTIQNAGLADEASYSVSISNGSTLFSAPARVVVIAPPYIIAASPSVEVAQGARVDFGVVYGGRSVALQWYKDGIPLPGETHPLLVIPAAQYTDIGIYSVRVSNIAGEETSAGALLEIDGRPEITAQPQGGTFKERSPFSLSVSAVGAGPLFYQWFLDGVEIAGATNAVLAVASASASAQGAYHAEVANAFGAVESSVAEVQILLLPKIVEQPRSARVARGSSAILSVTAEGPGPLQYRWLKNGEILAGQTNASIILESVQDSDTGSYYVSVRNAIGSITSLPASVVILEPVSIARSPEDQHTAEGRALSLEVEASGTGPLAYQWFKNGQALAGATNGHFTIESVAADDAGAYTVRVSNEVTEQTSAPALITVDAAPRIAGLGGPVTVNAGRSSFRLQPSAIAGTSPFAFQWYKNGAPLPGATTSSLVFGIMDAAAAGTYQLQVSNVVRAVLSEPVILMVRTAPVILVEPVGGEFTEGAALNLHVTAGGEGPFTYQWFLNGETIPGATGPAYAVGSLTEAHAGVYSVRVENDVSAVSSAGAGVVVTALKPRLVFQSQDQEILEGGSTILSAQARGASPLSFQWFKDGVIIAGATAPNLVFYGIGRSDAGAYTLSVENEHGRTSSIPITVSVTTPPGHSPFSREATRWVKRPIFVLQAVAGESFNIQGRRTLGPEGNWETLGSATAGDNGLLELAPGCESPGAGAFFRLQK